MIGFAIALAVIGVTFIVLGLLIWKKEMISLFHSYHTDKVSSENKQAFCRISGLGVIAIGIGIMVSGIVVGFTDSSYSFLVMALGMAIGLALLVTAGMKYNR